MKSTLFIFLVLPVMSFGQSTYNPGRLSTKAVSLTAEYVAPTTVQLPFESIRIIDSRYDTSKFGFTVSGNPLKGAKSYFRKLTFKGGVGPAIENYYNDYYRNAFQKNGFHLLIVLKKFWQSAIEPNKGQTGDIQKNRTVHDNIYIKWEYYLGRDSEYLPIKRIDTAFTITESVNRYIGEEFEEKKLGQIKFYLKGLIEILDYSNAVKAFDAQPKKSMDWIMTYNRSRFALPVLRDSNINRGIYMSFDEFRNNAPAMPDFQFKKIKYGLFNTITSLEDGNGKEISNYWGISNADKFTYGKLSHNTLYRQQHTYEMFVMVEWYTYDSNYAGEMHPSSMNVNKRVIWYPYQMDMETGKLY